MMVFNALAEYNAESQSNLFVANMTLKKAFAFLLKNYSV